ncbi:MAG: hypothetical protein IKW00_02190, partial [Clostridia bacterium]|nr:hypothetical protein [Clostridia bacterium]
MNRSLQRLSAWVLFLSLVLSMATGSAQATSSLSVDLRYTCSTSMPHTGSTLFFELSGTGTVDYC